MRMRSNLASLLVIAVGGVGLAACGSVAAQNDGGGGAGGNDGGIDMAPPTVEEACGQFASTLCSRLDSCAPYVLKIWYGDVATCMTRVNLGCTRDMEVPDTNETTADMIACARDAGNATCEDLIGNNLPASCQNKPGKRIDGEGCGSSWQCQSTHCEKMNSDCGVCGPRSSAGGACTVNEGCTQGLACAAGKCVTPGAAGAPCNDMAPCRPTLYCSQTSNACATPLPLGAACKGDANGCDFKNGVACNVFADMPKCEMIAAAKGGQACGIVNNTLTVCIENNTCNGVSLIPLSTMGTCPNTAGDGQACTDAVHCLPPANCVGGLCRLPSTASCTR
jgi:hypothetical protein